MPWSGFGPGGTVVSYFYAGIGPIYGSISESVWTDIGADLSSHGGQALLVGGQMGLPQYGPSGLPLWNNAIHYTVGNVVYSPGSLTPPNIFICIAPITGGSVPSIGSTFWHAAWPGNDGSNCISFQWSRTPVTLTPVGPPFGTPFVGLAAADEAGVVHNVLVHFDPPNPTPIFVPIGAVALFIRLPTGYAGYPGPGIINQVYLALNFYYFISPGAPVTEDRYACDGVFDYSAPRGDVLKSLVGSMAGTVIPPGDLWHVFAGAYNAPTAALTDADLRDSIKGDFRISRRDICNGVKGTFIPSFLPTNQTQTQPNAWRWTDFPPYQGNGLKGHPDYITEDGGQIIWKNARFGFTTSIWMVQRLAKILLQILRFQVTLHLACKLTAFPVQAGDTISFTHARWAALSPAPPTIYFVTQATLIVVNESGVPALGVDLMLRQHDPAIYQFNPPVSPTDQGEYSAYGTLGTM